MARSKKKARPRRKRRLERARRFLLDVAIRGGGVWHTRPSSNHRKGVISVTCARNRGQRTRKADRCLFGAALHDNGQVVWEDETHKANCIPLSAEEELMPWRADMLALLVPDGMLLDPSCGLHPLRSVGARLKSALSDLFGGPWTAPVRLSVAKGIVAHADQWCFASPDRPLRSLVIESRPVRVLSQVDKLTTLPNEPVVVKSDTAEAAFPGAGTARLLLKPLLDDVNGRGRDATGAPKYFAAVADGLPKDLAQTEAGEAHTGLYVKRGQAAEAAKPNRVGRPRRGATVPLTVKTVVQSGDLPVSARLNAVDVKMPALRTGIKREKRPAFDRKKGCRPISATISHAGSVTQFHRDDGRIWMMILRGQKEWFLAPPTEFNVKMVKRQNKSNGDNVALYLHDVQRVMLRENEIISLPKGWLHMVLTPTFTIGVGSMVVQRPPKRKGE